MSERPETGAELLARIKPTRREEVVRVCLRPDLIDAWENLNEELVESKMADASQNRLAGGISKKTRDLAKQIQDIEAEIEAVEAAIKFQAMPKDEWRTLCDNHPPRKGNELDLLHGYNRDAAEDEGVRRCVIDPVFDDDSWAQFVGMLNPSEWAELRRGFNSVNRSVTDAPKSPLASQVLTSRAGTSRQRATGA